MNQKAVGYFTVVLFFTLVVQPVSTQEASYLEKGRLAFTNRDMGGAVDWLRISVDQEAQTREEALFYLSKAALLTQDLTLAARCLVRHRRDYPEGRYAGEMIYLSGRLSFISKDYETSFDYFGQYLIDYQNNYYTPLAYYWLARCLVELKQYDDAQRVLVLFKNSYPDNSLLDQAERWQKMAFLLKARDNLGRQIAALEKQIREYLASRGQ